MVNNTFIHVKEDSELTILTARGKTILETRIKKGMSIRLTNGDPEPEDGDWFVQEDLREQIDIYAGQCEYLESRIAELENRNK